MNSKIQWRIVHDKKCNNDWNPAIPDKYGLARWLRLIFLIALLLLLYFAASAQKVSITANRQQLKEVLQQLRKQSGYAFMFNDRIIAKAKPVSLTVKGKEIMEVLPLVFKDQPLGYEVNGKIISITDQVRQLQSSASKDHMPVKGRVTDSLGNPLASVTVSVIGMNIMTRTDKSGFFSLEDVANNSRIKFSLIGYTTKNVHLKDDQNLAVIMTDEISVLDEAIVIAYGTSTKRLNTGSVSSVTSSEISSQPVSNPLAAMQGRVPGLVISQTSGVPGSAFNIQLRGQSALDLGLSRNEPLIIIDGVPFESGNSATNKINNAANNPNSISKGGLSPLNGINPADIERIDVLKDADATAIYGSRGANGVILITTKKGTAGKTQLSVNGYSGFSKVGPKINMLNTQQYVEMRKEALSNDRLSPSTDIFNPGFAPDIMLWDTTRYTDLNRLLIGKTAHNNKIQVTLSGGSELTQFRISPGFNRQTTVYPGSYDDKIASVNFNINHRTLNNKFQVTFSGMYSQDRNKLPRYDLTRYLNLPPNIRLYDASGNLSWDENGITYNSLESMINPLSLLNQNYDATNENLTANLNLSYNIVKGLHFRINTGFNSFRTDEYTGQPSSSIDPFLMEYIKPSAEFANSNSKSWIVEPQIEYIQENSFGKFNFLLGNTLQERESKSSYLYGLNYNSDLLLHSIAAAGSITASNDQMRYRYTAFFGRFNYAYKNTYILNISARRDGSSRFGPNRRWSNFGAVGLAWIFTNNSVFKNALSFVSFGKLRTSYGITGNDQIGDYKYLNLWRNTSINYDGISGLYPKSLYNPNFNWEKNKKYEVALELGLFKDRLLLSSAYYRNRSSSQLINYNLPGQTGFSNVVRNFPGLVENSGWEFTITSKNFSTRDFQWNTSFNVSLPKNRLISFPGLAESSYSARYVEGESLNVIKGHKYLGLDSQTGLYTFEDYNGDGMLSVVDYQILGNTDPKFYGGIQNNLNYKNFDLSFFFQFTKQTGSNYIAQLSYAMPGRVYNQPTFVLDRWRKPGDQTEIQKFSSVFGDAYAAASYLSLSDGRYTDASFIKLRNISLAYRFPLAWVKKIGLTSARIYVEGQNLFTITNYKGSDPEVQDFFVLPPLRTGVIGFQLNF